MNLYRAFRRGTIFKTLIGREPFYLVKPNPNIIELGSKYGDWAIDKTKISTSSTVVCVGLGTDVTFELNLIKQFGCKVFGFDPTPRSVQHIQEKVSHPNFQSFPYALADFDGHLQFTLPPKSVADQVSASAVAKYSADCESIKVPCLTLSSLQSQFNIPKIDILKLDIEGTEYSVIDQSIANGCLSTVVQLLVEFHHFLPGITPLQTRIAISKLQSSGYNIAWIGRTNHEYLFVRSE